MPDQRSRGRQLDGSLKTRGTSTQQNEIFKFLAVLGQGFCAWDGSYLYRIVLPLCTYTLG